MSNPVNSAPNSFQGVPPKASTQYSFDFQRVCEDFLPNTKRVISLKQQ